METGHIEFHDNDFAINNSYQTATKFPRGNYWSIANQFILYAIKSATVAKQSTLMFFWLLQFHDSCLRAYQFPSYKPHIYEL